MLSERKCGILCHITSLPNYFGIGDLGSMAYNFVDFLEKANLSYWQILPLTQPGTSFSPYQSVSMYGGNPLFISPEKLIENGLLNESEVEKFTSVGPVDFPKIIEIKFEYLSKACRRFIKQGLTDNAKYKAFIKENDYWLKENGLFLALRNVYGAGWNNWPEALANRKNIDEVRIKYKDDVEVYKVSQFFFYEQWKKLKAYANSKNIKIIGDLPMYLDYDSSTVWANKENFLLDENNNPTKVAGVPPDYFCEDGQYWGNPLYNWEHLKKSNYEFWVNRVRKTLELVDIVRLDHFRALSQAWEVEANEERCAKVGEWVDLPGYELLDLVKKEFPKMPIIAEDLGDIDKKVLDLRDHFNLPGMSVLEFAFDSVDSDYLPHNQERNRVLYTGTHDNDTIRGWWNSIDEGKKNYVRKYFSIDGNDINWQMIQAACQTVANTVIIPIQDVFNLDGYFRMNTPGVVNDSNWTFRFSQDCMSDYCVNRLNDIIGLYCRQNIKKSKIN